MESESTFTSLRETAFNTPLVELRRLFPSDLGVRALLKLETNGPTGSVKDRAVEFMLDAAVNLGLITPETRIVEASGGAAGLALAAAAAARGLRLTLFAPEGAYADRLELFKAFGTTLEFTPGSKGATGALKAARLAANDAGTWTPALFDNPANPAAHETTTGPEIWRAAAGNIDAFVAGVGSGGTFVGTSRFLRRQKPEIELIAVEPKECAALSGGKPASHGVVGLGAGFIPTIFDRSLPTSVETVSTDEALNWTRRLAETEGLLAGVSTGANLAVVARYAARRENHGKTIVTVAFSRR